MQSVQAAGFIIFATHQSNSKTILIEPLQTPSIVASKSNINKVTCMRFFTPTLSIIACPTPHVIEVI